MSRQVLHRVGLTLLLAAGAIGCGGGDPTVGALDGTGTTAVAGVLPSTVAGGLPTSTVAPVAGSPGDTAPAPTAPVVDAGAPAPAAGEPAASNPPEAGAYRLHTTGSGQVSPLQLTPQPVDEESTRTIERLNDTDIRQSEAAGQSTSLRYLADQVQLLRLDFVFPGVLEYHFVADPPVLFARSPLQPGDSWQWQLNDTGNRTTVSQSTTVAAPERIEVAGAAVDAARLDTTITFTGELAGTVRLTSWLDPARRTSVRAHQVSDLTYQTFRVTSDTTTGLVSFTPA